MYPRCEFEMSEDDFKKILDAGKPTPVLYLSGGIPLGGNPQENANRAWKRLGEKMGFDHMTVRPIQGKDGRFFTAIPSEPDEQRKEREKREAEEKRRDKMATLRHEIAIKQEELRKLED